MNNNKHMKNTFINTNNSKCSLTKMFKLILRFRLLDYGLQQDNKLAKLEINQGSQKLVN